MKYLYSYYHQTIIWVLYLLLLVPQSSDSASSPFKTIQQSWCYSRNHGCHKHRWTLGFANIAAMNHDRIMNSPFIIGSGNKSRYHRYLSASSRLLIVLRGGSGGVGSASNGRQPLASSKSHEQFIIRNPTSEMTLGDLETSYSTRRSDDDGEDDDVPLRREQGQGKMYHPPLHPKIRPFLASASTFAVPMQQYVNRWNQKYPILTQISLTCIFTFLAWHVRIQSIYKILSQYFICHRSHMTIWNGKFLSLLLSAVSHIDIWHLLYNLMALLSLGPAVQSILDRKFATTSILPRKYQHLSVFSSIDTAMWLLVLGAALSGSVAYLVWNEMRGIGKNVGGCLGLSSVTMSMLSIYASAFPDRILQFRIGGIIPIRLPADQILLLAFFGSMVGCLFPVIFKSKRDDGISHSGHLGGLIFGVAFYDIFIMNRRPFVDSFFLTVHKRYQQIATKNRL